MSATLGGMCRRSGGVARGRGVGPIVHSHLGLVALLLQVETLGRLPVLPRGVCSALEVMGRR